MTTLTSTKVVKAVKTEKKAVGTKVRAKAEVVTPVEVVAQVQETAPRHINLEPKYSYYYNQISNHNFELALLTESGDQILHTVVQCKDYFQDMFWCEYNKEEGSVYGLDWKPGYINLDSKFYEMALFGGSELMEQRAENLQKLLNYFDTAQEFDLTTVTKTDNPKIIVVKFSHKWTESGPLLSAFTSIIRVSGSYEGEDPKEYFKHLYDLRMGSKRYPSPSYSHVDIGRLTVIYPKLLALLEGKKVTLPWNKITSTANAHSTGIYGWTGFPIAELG